MDAMKKLNSTVIVCIVIIALCVVGMYRHKVKNLEIDNSNLVEAYQNEAVDNTNLRILVTKNKDSLSMARQTILTKDQAIALGLLREKELRNKHLKEVETVIDLTEEVRILKKEGTAVDPLFIEIHDTVYARLPLDLKFSDQWYNLSVTAAEIPLLNSLTVYSAPTLTLGKVKLGLLKKPERVTIYENANPYITLKDLSSVTIQENYKFYDRTWFKVLGGFAGGVVFSSLVK